MRIPRPRSQQLIALFCAGLLSVAAWADTPPARVSGNGGVTATDFSAPYSAFASPESLVRFQQMIVENRSAPGLGSPIEVSRAYYERINADRVERMKKLYPVKIAAQTIGGVPTDVVEPAAGIGGDSHERVLINLHGGGFLWGAHSGGLVESIPIASLGKIKVVSVDYRQGPEYVFPTASDDVEAVYRALLKHYKAKNIGIYGCSAGGFLTAESVARFISKHLPVPGAIGTFCASLVALDGDSVYTAPPLNGDAVPKHPIQLTDLPYFKGASPTDPQVLPGVSPQLLAKFPPTLLISGTRDFSMSSVIRSHALLTQAGVDADLHVWDGMWHSFFSDPELPESKDAYNVIVKFFARHLGH
ncbi:alpha/beta hydrolase [Dyella tabacisoli]|uniref:Alpha/beta hydrolase n=1 Tax=Dyella tabacisoli TaxID=2282381 RepID=A0A369UK82_9GAMM|nr:alpha/beta hydrolase [Dyella tabacisoli]RDD80525.1 alpha/beta hydrolase [Dyella tabacisoli]